jgi:hypothetical protein
LLREKIKRFKSDAPVAIAKGNAITKGINTDGWLRTYQLEGYNWQFLTSENFFNNVFWILHQSQESIHQVRSCRWLKTTLVITGIITEELKE